jgi:uncharacterized membrane protein
MQAGPDSADILAFAFLLAAWTGYTLLADHRFAGHGLMGVTARLRRRWMERMLERDNRIYDATLAAHVARSPNFFAQTSLIILGGLLAVAGAGDSVIRLVEDLPFARGGGALAWRLRLGAEVVIFIYAFFKFTWSMRQFNYVMILMGTAPPAGSEAARAEGPGIVSRAARMSDIATRHFNSGVRAYYFGLAALAGFVHPWLLVGATALVVLVLARREFLSATLAALKE